MFGSKYGSKLGKKEAPAPIEKNQKARASVIQPIPTADKLPTRSNGNGKHDDKTDKTLEALDKLRESGVLQKVEEHMNNQQEEKSKYTVLHDLSSVDEDKLKMHTELDKTEVLILNKLHFWGLLAPRVFGNSDKNKEIVKFVNLHAREHRLNKMSLGRKREFSLVHAVRGDNSVTQTENAIQKVFKYK